MWKRSRKTILRLQMQLPHTPIIELERRAPQIHRSLMQSSKTRSGCAGRAQQFKVTDISQDL